MAVTIIKEVINNGATIIRIRNVENPGDTGGHGNSIALQPSSGPAGTSKWTHDMWIPWATSQGAFAAHRVEIAVDGIATLYIWQAQMSDGDGVRGSTDGWHDNDHFINGSVSHSAVGGNRVLLIGSAGSTLSYTLGPWPFKTSPDGT